MTAREAMDQNKDTTGWSVVGLIIGLVTSSDLLVQAVVAILVPVVGWTVLYFWKREIAYRFPPKNPKALRDENEEDE